MKFRSGDRRAFGCLVLLAAARAASADGYIGLALGDSGTACVIAAWASSCDGDADAYEAFGGYQFNSFFALEASHIEYGGLVASPYFGIGWHSDGDATAVTAKGVVPLSERFSLFGKAGLARWSLTSYGFDSEHFGPQHGTDTTVGQYILLAGGITKNVGDPNGIYLVSEDGTHRKVRPTDNVSPGSHLYVAMKPLFQANQAIGNFFITTGWITSIVTTGTVLYNFLILVGIIK